MFTNVLIGLPIYDQSKMQKELYDSLKTVEEYNNDHSIKTPHDFSFEIIRVGGTSSLFARNYAASKGSQKIKQKLNYDYYLSIDEDMAFGVLQIIQLIKRFEELKKSKKSCNIGILGAAYPGRGAANSHKVIAGNFSEVIGDAPIEKYIPYSCNDTIQVDWCGTGFMLISKEVLEELPFPWFRANVIVKGDESSLTTEDIGICMDVKEKLEKSIWVDCSIRIAHLVH